MAEAERVRVASTSKTRGFILELRVDIYP